MHLDAGCRLRAGVVEKSARVHDDYERAQGSRGNPPNHSIGMFDRMLALLVMASESPLARFPPSMVTEAGLEKVRWEVGLKES